MSKNLNTKTIVKKVTKKEVILSSDSDNESSSDDELDDIVTKKKIIKDNKHVESDSESDNDPYCLFEDLNILKSDLIQLKLGTNDCCVHYYHMKEKCMYSKFKTNKWFKPNESLQKQLRKMCNERGEPCDVIFDDKPKKVPPKKVTKVGKDVEDSSDKKKDDTKEKKTRNKLSKNEMYKEDQHRTFEELKQLINVKKNNTFTSEDVKNQNDIIVTNILEKLKKYYGAGLSRGINTSETKASVAIIRKIFKYHGFELATKEYANGDVRGIKYVMVSCNDDGTDEEKNDIV
jgi:hypothetical protein